MPRTLSLAHLAIAGVGAIAVTIGACSLLIERRDSQCETDADCAGLPDAKCDVENKVCVYACINNPDSSADLLNSCPREGCTPFDNTRVGALVNGEVPPLPADAPDAGPRLDSSACPSGSGGGGSGGSGSGGAGGGGDPVPVCEELASPLYVLGPSSVRPLLGWVAHLFALEGITTVVYQDESSCTAVDKMYTSKGAKNDPGNEAYTSYYDVTGAAHPCKFVAADVVPHIALSDVFPQTCGFDLNHSEQDIQDTPGPVQAMGFIVPNASTETSLSAEAAYMVYGFGSESGVEPWTDQRWIYQRTPSSGTQNMIAKAIGVDPKRFYATPTVSSDDEATLVGCSPEPQKTIGLLAVDLVQTGQYPIKLLAYQHHDQECGFLPDSAADKNDKRNVRDGRYFIWGAIHMLSRKSLGGLAGSKAKELIQYVSGIAPPPNAADLFQIWADAHLIPQCAMRVTRSSDGGPLVSVTPPSSCYCKYDEVTGGAGDCTKCQSASSCPPDKPACNFGYCEVK